MPYYPPVPTGGFYEQQYLVQYENAVPVAQTMPAQYQVAAPQAAWSQGYYNGQPAALPPMPQPVVQQYAVYPPGGYTYYTHDQLRLRTDPQVILFHNLQVLHNQCSFAFQLIK